MFLSIPSVPLCPDVTSGNGSFSRLFLQSNINMPNINPNISLADQNLQRKTLAMLAMFNLNYWCESEEEKQKLLQQYAKNEKVKEAEIREKYNPDEIFKNKNEVNKSATNVEMIEYKRKNFIQDIIQKIQKLFKTRKG